MRARAHQRTIYMQKEKARKARLSKQGSAGSMGTGEEEGEGGPAEKAKDDVFKKDVTTDHQGKIIA